jgi:enamine deaminase RidA (YjgF/YER057c/UK114 family)
LNINELSPIQQLTVAQYLYKRVAGIVSTKDPESLRTMCDHAAIDRYEAEGAKSFDLKLDGQKVGTYSVKVSKPKRATERTVLVVDDWDAYLNECCDELWSYVKDVLIDASSDVLDAYFDETGDVPTWAHAETRRTPAEPPVVTGTTLRVDADAVAEAMGPMFGERVMGLLGGAE